MDPHPASRSHGFLGISPQIVHIRGLIEKLGRSRSPVLLLGESGTGKEVAAREIYNGSRQGAFVPIDCGSVVGPLIESDLFGHTRNAFTGAGEAKQGLIDLAHGGTAFFDEIGDLPLDLQVKLLRVLQEREIRPVGSLARHKVDFRVIAATNRDLASDVERGRFREDLYYRLKVVTLRIPPLRERKGDVPVLIEHFLSRLDRRYILTPEVLDAMLAFDWPGNVRQLENCIQSMVALNSGPILRHADLPSFIVNHRRAYSPLQSLAAAVGFDGGVAGVPMKVQEPQDVIPLCEVEKRAIQNALLRTQNDCIMAAHLLGIGKSTLYRKLKEYRLPH
ncbi:MAG: sigma-54-dependent Fis family transcriptional regulator [Bryobacterales bacterium]|nr:sigma-54-dependent Fis family transcriptional regulator [Bryobacterales bacterium]